VTPEAVTIVFTVIGGFFAWTVALVAGVAWLNSKLNKHEHLVYRENTKTREMLNKVLNQHSGRIMRLELGTFGSTLAEPPEEP